MKNLISILKSTIIALVVLLSLNAIAQTPQINLIQPTDPGIEWTIGGTYLISWTDNFQSTTDILLSSDGGATYPTVLESGLSGSTWTWNTSGLSVANNYKIKVQSSVSPASYFDVSANKFALVDETAGSITLNQPTGNESIAQGTSYLISWNDNLTVPVKVELLENNVLKTTISASTTATTLNWTVPSTGITLDSKIYKIKISSTVAGSTTTPATSGRFTITSSSGTYVEVLQPNGGELWAVGTSHLISWNDDLGESVNIELYKSGTYTEIASDVTGSTYVWNIPSTETTSTNCRVRISSSLDASIKDRSDSRFSLTASTGSFVEVLQPNGGESWAIGTSHLISWNDDFAEAVNIELYNSGSYSTIASGITGSTWVWNIPSTQVAGSHCRIRVSSSLDGSINDRSDSRFSLTESAGTFIEVLQPNGGERWARGTNHLISWNDDLTEPVNIKLYKWGTFITDIASDVSGSTYSWDILSTIATGNGYKVKIISTLDDNLKDYSDAKFRITASAGTYIEVLQPNGGESWAVGTTHLISWIDDLPENVNIKLYKWGTFITDIASDVSGSTYSWDISSSIATGTGYKVKIISTLDNNINDRTDGNFEIKASTGTFIEVLQPNGGESWARGNAYLITWNDDLFEDVDIKLYKGGVLTDIADDVSGSSYTWNIPAGQTVGTNYKVKIISSLDPGVSDYSDANFAITASAGTYITVQQPNGGEDWVRGNDYLISWISDCTEDVDIKLIKGGTVTDIASGVSGSTYTWSIPSNQITGSNFKVKIISTLDATLYDLSNSNFSISASSGTYVTVGQPNGGESLIRGTSYLITWSDDFPEDVNIELYRAGSTTTIANGVSGSTYTWNIPSGQTPASNYKVKIYSILDATIKDFSDANFSIAASSMMTVYPNPANQNITLRMENNNSGIFQIIIYDRFNMVVTETSINTQASNEVTIPTSLLSNGVYFVTLTSGDYRSSKKIIVQH